MPILFMMRYRSKRLLRECAESVKAFIYSSWVRPNLAGVMFMLALLPLSFDDKPSWDRVMVRGNKIDGSVFKCDVSLLLRLR